MSTKGESLYHPVNGSVEATWDGFSWPAFFFGLIWLAVKGLWGHFVVNLLVLIVTAGFAAPVVWIVYGFIGNGAHKNSLLKKGYLSEAQRDNKTEAPPARSVSLSPAKSKIDQLQDLASLREKGHLTDDEFASQKAKLLAT